MYFRSSGSTRKSEMKMKIQPRRNPKKEEPKKEESKKEEPKKAQWKKIPKKKKITFN